MTVNWKFRIRASSVHVCLSATTLALLAALVFGLWYPGPYAWISGGTNLFEILLFVDVIVGPTLTFIVANRTKSRQQLIRDFSFIAIVQIAALVYGVRTIALARPVACVFEMDLMRVVSASEIDRAMLAEAPRGLTTLSWRGPKLLSVIKPATASEQFDSIQLSMNGVPLAAQPRYWRGYSAARARILKASHPLSDFVMTHPALRHTLRDLARKARVPESSIRFLPLVSRSSQGIALVVDPSADIVGFLNIKIY